MTVQKLDGILQGTASFAGAVSSAASSGKKGGTDDSLEEAYELLGAKLKESNGHLSGTDAEWLKRKNPDIDIAIRMLRERGILCETAFGGLEYLKFPKGAPGEVTPQEEIDEAVERDFKVPEPEPRTLANPDVARSDLDRVVSGSNSSGGRASEKIAQANSQELVE